MKQETQNFIDITEEMDLMLDNLAKEAGISKDDILKRAIALLRAGPAHAEKTARSKSNVDDESH